MAAAELLDLRQQLKQKDSEIDQLHSLILCMRSDLEVKEEQFDVLYRSLRASREHSQQESRVQESQQETRLLAALGRIQELEAAVAAHDLERRTWHAELQKAREGSAGFGDWIGRFMPGIAVACRGFTKMRNEGQRQYQQITVFKTGTS